MSSIEKISNGYKWLEQECPICDSAPKQFVGRRGGSAHRENLGIETKIWKCKECGLLFPDPMPVPVRGLAQHYALDPNEYFAKHDGPAKCDNALQMVRRAEELLGHKGSLLDVGVGRGEIVEAAKTLGWEVDGIEPSTTFADHVEKKTGVKIRQTSIEEADLPSEAYDCIILAAVLEHLYDPDLVIKKLSASLKPGGLLYLDVPNEQGLYFVVGNLYQKLRGREWCVNLAPTFSPYHVFGFSSRSLRKLLSKHSLKPMVWRVYPGVSLVGSRGGVVGFAESVASKTVTSLSRFGGMGTYIETWAEKI
jgi:SAM-dependent methyltransferase